MGPKWKKLPKSVCAILNVFVRFLTFLCNFSQLFDTLASFEKQKKLFSKERIRSPRGFDEEPNAFCNEKMTPIRTEAEKVSKNFRIKKNHAIFWKIWWLRMLKTFNNKRSHYAGRFCREIKEVFFLMTKTSKKIHVLMQLLSKFKRYHGSKQ